MPQKNHRHAADLENLVHQAQHLTPEKATRFFKTGPSDYAHHDRFIGVGMPALRQIAKKHTSSFGEIHILLQSPFNEVRTLALLLLLDLFKKPDFQKEVFEFYLKNLSSINNWNLVDLSASAIVGAFLWQKKQTHLMENLAVSENLWERRIAIVSTYFFIKHGVLEPTFQLCRILLNDREDLMHKACGWMLREAGKKDKGALIQFLSLHEPSMPRVMWRYATEKLSSEEKSFIQQA